LTGGIRYDIDQNRVDLYTVGLNYLDECFSLMATYTYDNTNQLTGVTGAHAESYSFDTNGNRITDNVSNFMDTVKLGYVYDRLEPVPDCPIQRDTLIAAAQNQKKVAMLKASPVKLGEEAVKVTLEPVPAREGEEPMAFRAQVKAMPAGHRLFLVIKDLRADVQPGVAEPRGVDVFPVAADRVRGEQPVVADQPGVIGGQVLAVPAVQVAHLQPQRELLGARGCARP